MGSFNTALEAAVVAAKAVREYNEGTFVHKEKKLRGSKKRPYGSAPCLASCIACVHLSRVLLVLHRRACNEHMTPEIFHFASKAGIMEFLKLTMGGMSDEEALARTRGIVEAAAAVPATQPAASPVVWPALVM